MHENQNMRDVIDEPVSPLQAQMLSKVWIRSKRRLQGYKPSSYARSYTTRHHTVADPDRDDNPNAATGSAAHFVKDMLRKICPHSRHRHQARSS